MSEDHLKLDYEDLLCAAQLCRKCVDELTRRGKIIAARPRRLHLNIIVDDFEGFANEKALRAGACDTCHRRTVLVESQCALCMEHRFPDLSQVNIYQEVRGGKLS